MIALKSFLAAAALTLGLTGAQAATVEFRTLQSGADLGNTVLATLNAAQVGSDVEFTLTNNTPGNATSFISQLFLTYVGARNSVTLGNVAGVATGGLSKGSITNAGLAFQFAIRWPTANTGNGALRLNPGESSTFRLLNTTLAGFFQGTDFGMVHVQGLPRGQSTKYTGSFAAPVPVPAAGFLMLGALGGLGLLRRRRRAA